MPLTPVPTALPSVGARQRQGEGGRLRRSWSPVTSQVAQRHPSPRRWRAPTEGRAVGTGVRGHLQVLAAPKYDEVAPLFGYSKCVAHRCSHDFPRETSFPMSETPTPAPNLTADAPTAPALADNAAAEAALEAWTAARPLGSGRDEATVMQLFGRLRGPAQALRNGDDNSLRDHLVILHAPLVEHCARNFLASGEPLDDLLQEGYVGLIKAVDRFDPFKGVRFSTYACHLITGEIRHYLRDLGKMIHEPGWHSELRQRIARTADSLTQQLGRPATPDDIAEALSVRVQTVRDVLRNSQVLAVDSLDAERNEGEEGEPDERRENSAPFGRAVEPQVEDRVMLGNALPQLRDLEKRAIQLFFFEENSKTEVAQKLGISVNYAAYLIKQGTQHLREIIEGSDLATTAASPSEARAAHLLSLLKTRGESKPERKNRKPHASVSPAALADFATFVAVLDEEVSRAARYEQQTCLLWLHLAGWSRITAKWPPEESARAIESLLERGRNLLRSGDRITALTVATLPDLHLLILLPHTGHNGAIVEARLKESLLHKGEFPSLERLSFTTALAILPQHGQNTDALFTAVGQHLDL